MASRIGELFRGLRRDAIEMTRARGWSVDRRSVRKGLVTDAYRVLVLQRLRELALSLRLDLISHFLRRRQTAAYGVEISRYARVGCGVYFAHPVGVVIGGDSMVGDRVVFYGSNTLGAMEGSDYPILEEDVSLGAGARVLGKVRIGARARIGANAVVLTDVPADTVAVGVPARVVSKLKPPEALRAHLPDDAGAGPAAPPAGQRGSG